MMDIYTHTDLKLQYGDIFTIHLLAIVPSTTKDKNVWKVIINNDLLYMWIPTNKSFKDQEVTPGDIFEVKAKSKGNATYLNFRRLAMNEEDKQPIETTEAEVKPTTSNTIPISSIVNTASQHTIPIITELAALSVPQVYCKIPVGTYTNEAFPIRTDSNQSTTHLVIMHPDVPSIIRLTSSTVLKVVKESCINYGIKLTYTVSKTSTGKTNIKLTDSKRMIQSIPALVTKIEDTFNSPKQECTPQIESTIITKYNTATSEVATVTEQINSPHGTIYWYSTNLNPVLKCTSSDEFNLLFPDTVEPWYMNIPRNGILVMSKQDDMLIRVTAYDGHAYVEGDDTNQYAIEDCTPLTNEEIKQFLQPE